MPVVTPTIDLERVAWRRVTQPECTDFLIDFEYSLLGYDRDTGRLDMLLRYAPNGHCRRHRHLAATATLVLEGEQFLVEGLPDGTVKHVHRKAGDYALSPADAQPHDEFGGPEGGTVLLSMSAPDGQLFEYSNDTNTKTWTLSIDQYVDSWERGELYGQAAS